MDTAANSKMMDKSRRQKLTDVSAWLVEVLGERNVPSFEVDEFTVSILDSLMCNNTQMDCQLRSYAACVAKMADDYRQEAARLETILESVGVRPTVTSPKGWLSVLTDLATTLEITGAADANYSIALAEVADQRQRILRERDAEDVQLKRIATASVDALARRSTAEAALLQLRASETRSRDESRARFAQADFLRGKTAKYATEASLLERRLRVAAGSDDELVTLRHERLLERATNLAEFSSRLDDVTTKLAAYRDLPADVSLARAKVELARSEVAELEADLARRIDLMHL